MLVRSDAYFAHMGPNNGVISRNKEAIKRVMLNNVELAIFIENNLEAKEEIRRRNLTEKGELLADGYILGNQLWVIEKADAYSIDGVVVDSEMYVVDIEIDEVDKPIIFYGLKALGFYLYQKYAISSQVLDIADKMVEGKLSIEDETFLSDKFRIHISSVAMHPYWMELM